MHLKILALVSLLFLTGCEERPKFWYPVEKLEVTCNNVTFQAYRMKHSTGWRSWPYYVDTADNKEVIFHEACMSKIIYTFPDIERISNLSDLTIEQRSNVIMGGV